MRCFEVRGAFSVISQEISVTGKEFCRAAISLVKARRVTVPALILEEKSTCPHRRL